MKFFKKDASPKQAHNNNNHYNNNNNNNNNAVISDYRKPMYHWQSEGSKKSSADDMVLLTKITEAAITDNLKRRFMEDKIYTYIGPVLVAVNPFKQLPYFGERELELYQGAASYEVPPHIYAVADAMYRNMLTDSESQCVIISGESGAGKTVSAKFIMNYITKVSKGTHKVQHIKEIILESNPLLESFGNAKTTRNNNSSRFGKYIEIQFSRGGEPLGGKISNFLLEKSRVHSLNHEERSFHIFYQLCAGASDSMKSELGIASPEYYTYLSENGVYKVDNMDDAQDFQETLNAMTVMGIEEDIQMDILRIVAAIMHMGNITFVEQGNAAQIEDPQYLAYPAYLLGVDEERLKQKLVSRVFDSKWGGRSERVDVTLNEEQAQFTRDAWTKGLYSRLFDYIVDRINKAMTTDANLINLGILDIYGFEIFDKNGFEQFCINYVNEKLQQIFIDLTLKSEQNEYEAEGIQWKQIQYFDNKVVCELIEDKTPPGIMCILDDTCATMSAKSEGADEDFHRKLGSQIGSHEFYQKFNQGFTIKHYAGNVSYHVEKFCEKNRDVLFTDIIEVMQNSSNAFIRSLFPDVIQTGAKGRPTTAGMKIRTQANHLVDTLMKCYPHYIRCIKPNETKKPHDWDENMCKHQVEYLGLKENIRVKRAGFAYRRPFEKFLQRYSILSKQTWPSWHGNPIQAIDIIMREISMDPSQYQAGRTKVFIKDPESLYMIEECRERKLDHYARIIQNAFRKLYSKKRWVKSCVEASNLIVNRKERRAHSLNRNFHGDYIGVEFRPGISALIPRREKVIFALMVDKIDRSFKKSKRDLILTRTHLYLIGRMQIKKGPEKGKTQEIIKRRIPIENITQATLSPLQDNLVLVHVNGEHEMFVEVEFKVEFIYLLNRNLKERCGKELPLNFTNSFTYRVKKMRWSGASEKKVVFKSGLSDVPVFSSSGSTLSVSVGPGLSKQSQPTGQRVISPDVRILAAERARAAGGQSGQAAYANNTRTSSASSSSSTSNYSRKPFYPPKPAGPAPKPTGFAPKPTGPAPKPPGPAPKPPGSAPKPFPGNSIPKPSVTPVAVPRQGPVRPPFLTSNQNSQNGGVAYPGRPNAVKQQGFRLPQNTPSNNHAPCSPPFPAIHPPPPPSEPAPANQPSIRTRPPPPTPVQRPKPSRPQVKALYPYNAADSDELTFEEGDILYLDEEEASGWWKCTLHGKSGFCPSTYLEKI